jgi:predicted RNase H-like HicB family nuclease
VKYAVVFERTERNYAAYVPDLPGCVATGKDRTEVERNIREAIALHLEGMREDGEPIPEPTTETALVEVGA